MSCTLILFAKLRGYHFLCFDQLRLEALSQMSSFLSKMEEKNNGLGVSPQFPALLQSVQLQFLSGCFALGTQIIGSHTGANYEMQHYMVHLVIMLIMFVQIFMISMDGKN